MLEKTTTARLVLTTTATAEEARSLGRRLVEEQLVACVSILPSIESIYPWQGAIEEAHEALLLLKTTEEKLPILTERLATLHSYSKPELLALPIVSGSASYLHWLYDSLQ